MSFILDALRKSEHERQRQSTPGIADLQSAAARPRFPVWALALGALLVVNIAVVLVLVLRGETKPVMDTNAAPAPVPVASAAPPASPQSNPPQAGAATATPPVLDAEEQFPESVDASEEALGDEYLSADPELTATASPVTSREATPDENLPTLNDVTLQGTTNVPELHLDLHAYAAAPADRFVFLNMRKYREGEETPEGIRVERITRDGVVLNHRGVRFLLPRQ